MKYLQVIAAMIFLLMLLNFIGKIWKPEATGNSVMDVNITRVGGLSQKGRTIQVIVK